MTWLRGLALADGTVTDLLVDNGRVAAAGTAPPGAPGEDRHGWLALPLLVDAHIHLDKTFLGCPPVDPGVEMGGLMPIVASEHRIRPGLPLSTRQRAELLVRQVVALGTGALRSHADVDPGWGMANVEALLDLRAAVAGRVPLQVVAFPQSGILRSPGTAELLEEAARLGVDAIGGLDPVSLDGDLDGHLGVVFSTAARHGLGIDLHLHDPGETGLATIERVCALTEEHGLRGRVAVSHAYALHGAPDDRLAQVADRLAAAQVAVMTNVPIHGAPPLTRLVECGVTVALGSDNIQDAFSPFGDGDLLRRVALAAAHEWAHSDETLRRALALATSGGAAACGLPDPEITVGGPADLLLVRAVNLRDALARLPAERVVLRGGVPLTLG